MDNTYIVIPNLSLEDKSLNDSEIIVLAVITGLMGKYGFCWASNKYLAEKTRKSKRQIQYIISSLKKKKYLIIEVEYNNDRKIWTPGTWAYRDKYIEVYGKEVVECRSKEEFNQRFTRDAIHCVGGTQSIAPYYTIDNIQRHKEESAPPPPSKIQKQNQEQERPPDKPKQPDVTYLKPMLITGHVPSPGRQEMVAETKEFISRPLECGTKRYVIADKDKEWFYGFSPKVLEVAATRIHLRSKKGDKISKYTVMLFSECAKVRSEK